MLFPFQFLYLKAECGISSYCDFVKRLARAVLVMNGWRAADCKHTCTVKWWRIASSFVFTQGHSERAWGPGSMEQGERRERCSWVKWREWGMPLLSFSILLSFPQWADLLLITRLDSRSGATSPRLKLKAGSQQMSKSVYVHVYKMCLSIYTHRSNDIRFQK